MSQDCDIYLQDIIVQSKNPKLKMEIEQIIREKCK